MKSSLKKTLKAIMPPFIASLFRFRRQYGFFGNYKSWSEALKHSHGYDNPAILDKVCDSLFKVKNGRAAYERDSVTFDHIQYSWPVLAALLWVGSEGHKLTVLDFGGSLGSSYYQNKQFLSHIPNLAWHIVEQKNFIECGKENFEDQTLKFFDSIEASEHARKTDVFFASSSIQYLEDPYTLLEKVLNKNFPYLIFDRTTFLTSTDRLTVQKVPPRIYDSSYPAWFLSEKKFLEMIARKYDLVTDFDSLAGEIELDGDHAYEKGFIFKRK